MSYAIQQSTTQSCLMFLMIESADHITGLTGASPTVVLSKNGASFASPAGAVTEVGNGWYKVAGNATDTNTLGPLALHATAASADPSDILVAEIVAYNPQDAVHLGLSCLPNTAVTTNASLLTSGTGTDQISVSSGQTILQSGTGTGQLSFTSGVVKSNLAQILGTALTETAGQIAAAFKKLFDVASPVLTAVSVNQTGDNYARLGAPAGASVSADIAAAKVDTAAIKVQTDKLTFTVANQIDANVLDWKSATAPAMTGDAYALMNAATTEPASVPAATASRAVKIDYLFTKTRNKSTQTATTQTLLADDNSTTIGTVTVSDDGTTFTKGKDT